MKKILWMVACCMIFSLSGRADVCEGSTFTGKNGHTYCYSTQEMNWYAALSWCSAQGRHLASLTEACDYDGKAYGTNSDICPNLSDMNNSFSTTTVWLANPCIGQHGLSSYVTYAKSSGAAWVNCTFNGNRGALAAYHPHALCY